MTSLQKKGFIVIVILQLLILSYMIYGRLTLLSTGTPVLLKCRPVDPRSLFSGDYVILNYEISRFSKEEFKTLNLRNEKFKSMETIYVGMVKNQDAKFHNAAEVSHDITYLKSKYSVVLRGELQTLYDYRIRYGVESYFVPQHEGKQIERELRKAHVEAVVSDKGETAIRKLFLGDKEVRFN